MVRILASMLLLFASVAQADIYKYVDERGRITYSNVPMKGGKKLNLDTLNTIPGAKAGTQSPADFPKVDANTQKKRDGVRGKILEDELKAEEQALKEAQRALKEGEAVRMGDERNYQKYLDRIQKLKDAVAVHETNIEAIKKEMTGLK